MRYKNIKTGTFIKRLNRFTGKVLIDGKEEMVHIKNTGRCEELLLEGAKVYLEDFRNIDGISSVRKTKFSLISVYKPATGILINIDSQAPNKVVEEALLSGRLHLSEMTYPITVKREQKYMESRFDFYIEDSLQNKGYIEVKGVSLEVGGTAMFPDAPTKRGTKHLHELITAAQKGFSSYVIFVVQLKGACRFTPNRTNDPDFSKALSDAFKNGVHVKVIDCLVTADEIVLDNEIKTMDLL